MAIYQDPARNEVKGIAGIIKTLNLGAIGATTILKYNIEDRQPTWVKYLPFDSVTIVNDSGSDLLIEINMDSSKTIAVPASTQKTVSNYAIRSFTVTTDAVAVLTQELRMEFERIGTTADTLAKAIAKNVFFRALFGGR